MSEDDLLEVRDLKVHFGGKKLFRKEQTVHAVDGVSFSVPKGKTLGIVGESGSGKRPRLHSPFSGWSRLRTGRSGLADVEISALEKDDLREARRKVQMVFQDPYSSLDPRRRVGDIVREPLDLMDHR